MLKANKSELSSLAKNIIKKDNIHVLCHQYPDGDTIGSAVALSLALLQKGKRVKLLCCDKIPSKYDYITRYLEDSDFNPNFVIAVDVADENLLGDLKNSYRNKIDICIDHHEKNSNYAKECFIDPDAAATSEIIYKLIKEMNVEISREIAESIYTGISTDTGCFKYANATYETYLIAADMIKCGARASMINKIMFDTKTIEKIKLEKLILDTVKLYFDKRCATIYLSKAMIEESQVSADDLDGISSIPRKISGVLVGITFREKDNNEFKVSVRSEDPINACKICSEFGGGGHKNAAGCTIKGSLDEVVSKVLDSVKKELKS